MASEARSGRPLSPKFSETIENNLFMRKVIPSPTRSRNSPKVNEDNIRRSLEEISREIKDIEDFITVTENIIRSERERDRELYARERRRKADEKRGKISDEDRIIINNKENKAPTAIKQSPVLSRKNSQKSPSFKINSYKVKKAKPGSPKFLKSKLYFRNGKIGCADAEQSSTSNIESTHALIKHILKYENEKPLVSLESVEKVLSQEPEEQVGRAIENGHASESNANEKGSLDLPDLVPSPARTNEEGINGNNAKYIDLEFSGSPEVTNEDPQQQARKDSLQNRIIDKTENVEEEMNTQEIENLDNEEQKFVREQVHHLVRRFTARTNKMRSRIEMPPTPSSSSSPSPPPPHQSIEALKIDTLDTKVSTRNIFQADNQSIRTPGKFVCPTFCGGGRNDDVLDPQGKVYIYWLCVVSLSFLYNAWVIPLRSSFPFQTEENQDIWLALDTCADLIYLFDVLFFKHRVMYLFEGFWVKDRKLTRKNYMRKLQFKLDIISMIPLDLLYLKYGRQAVYFRFPRLLKIQTFWEVFKLIDRVMASPHFVRVAKTMTYMLYMIHLTACAYYAYSAYQGLGTNRWVFSGKGHPYVRCFAFATKTATSIGKNPKPEKEGELVFMTSAWLMGVFVFALLIGQIRDIISTATRTQSEYRQLEDETLEYMRRQNLPINLQRRVKGWFKFTWDQQRTLDESHILDSLPANLKTDIALSVHIQTLSKVQLFADCEDALLRELVLKLRSVTFLAGDYVCRKGEVGKEMYIIKLGQVQVMGGPNNDEVLATLCEGSVFGEISLLAINGAEGNRRTADVRSRGFSNLFVLSKSDLNEAIVYYPNAQAILKKRARSLMRKNAAREREEARRNASREADVVIGNPTRPNTPPKLLKTVIQALPEESPAAMLLTRGSKRNKKRRETLTDTEESKNEDSLRGSKNEMIAQQTKCTVENERRALSPDLLSSIEDELKNQNKLINLTDSEKALIMSTNDPNEHQSSTSNANLPKN
ncbi:unnamed protein product [Hermetia illucens]|uniref:Cyclic nucleotide-binding domain-containing protein n=2 Tax=Hermetia illucens TaxID=343691 RepID=A0A7R8UXG7_HERIL|nr:cyclic nucleotide-gated cation channel beta-3 isoform X3 [Hermetia illucens]CAD7088316.1 unnamed protein product [Hermetia illucens]